MTQGDVGRDSLDYEETEVALAVTEVRAACSSLLALCAEDKGSLGDRFAALALQQISRLLRDETSSRLCLRSCLPEGCYPKSFLDFRPVSQASGLPSARKRPGLANGSPAASAGRDLALRSLLVRIRQLSKQRRFRGSSARRTDLKKGCRPNLSAQRASEADSGFNIFRTLRIEHKEVITHSRLLASLLDPYGSHGQGALFLNAFLRLLQQRLSAAGVFWPSSQEWQAHCDRWQVYEEYHTTFGRLDLLLENKALKSAIVVENKLGAGDQPGQLLRYWSWLEQERGHWPYIQLVYLSPQGRFPDHLAFSDAKTSQAQQRALAESLLCLSYREDISCWLQGCWRQNYSGDLASVLRQYQRVLERL
ncbi:PD-(D/E)XK nuclease family protein [Rhodovibrionaceae bacterium A322]